MQGSNAWYGFAMLMIRRVTYCTYTQYYTYIKYTAVTMLFPVSTSFTAQTTVAATAVVVNTSCTYVVSPFLYMDKK